MDSIVKYPTSFYNPPKTFNKKVGYNIFFISFCLEVYEVFRFLNEIDLRKRKNPNSIFRN